MNALDILNTGLEILGAVGMLCTTLGMALPKAWRFTLLCAKLGADLRGLHKPAAGPPGQDTGL